MGDGTGLPTNPAPAPGAAEYALLKSRGFDDAALSQWAGRQSQALRNAGFTESQISAHWGTTDPHSAALVGMAQKNLGEADDAIRNDPAAAFAAGFGMSVAGLIIHGKKPDQVMAQDAGLLDRIANSAGQMVGDLPASVAGFFGGAVGGGAAAGAAGSVIPVLGTAAGALGGSVVGAGIGSAALPEASRQILLDAYEVRDGNVRTWQDALALVSGSLIATGKQAVIGGVTAPLGGAVAGKAIALGARPFVAAGADATAQALSATAIGGAMDGHVPDKEDFAAGALLAVAFHTGAAATGGVSRIAKGRVDRVQSNLEQIYRQTGMTPWEAATRAQTDPVFRSELVGQDVHGDPVIPAFRSAAPNEPEPLMPAQPVEGKTPPVATAAAAVTRAPVLRAGSFQEAKTMLIGLEGSAQHAKAHGIKESDVVSPAGAIGKFQIMPGTARQYGFDPKRLFEPAYNEHVADAIIGDLHRRYHGDMAAIAIAYNAGPGRANTYLKQGPGTRLKATPDKNARGGVRYEHEPAARNEAFLPMETQKYLANARRRGVAAGGETPEPGRVRVFPSVLAEAPEGVTVTQEGPARPAEAAAPDPALVAAWKDEGADARVKEIMSNIGEEPRPASLTTPDVLMNQFISELTPARNIDTRLIKGGEFDRDRDIGMEDMFRQTYASDSRAGAFVRYGIVDPQTLGIREDSASFAKATKAAAEDGGSYDGWIAWMLANRTVEAAGRGIKTGFNAATAFAHVADAAEAAKYKRATDLFQETNNGAIDYLVASGVQSAERAEKMKAAGPTYISMRRVMGDDQSFATGNGRSFKVGDPLRRMEGSDRQIVEPMLATIDNVRLMVKMADRNRAIAHVVKLVEGGKLPGFTKEALTDAQSLAEGAKALKPYGIEATPENIEAYLPILAERASAKLAPNQFLFFRDGVAEKWSTKDPALAELIRKADTPGQANIVMKAFETAAKFQRAGIVSVPDFPVRNLLRDQVAAFILDPLHPPPFVTAISGIMDVVGQSKVYQDFVARGGMGTTLAEMDADWMARDVHKIFEQTGTYNGVANAFRHPLEFAQIISERFEAASRVGYYKHALNKGVEPIKAATMSRKAYLDFAERGTLSLVNTMAKVTPFFRPALLGLKQVGEAFAERPFSTPAYAIAAVAVPAVAMYALNYFADQALPDDEKYANHPRWEKDSFYITPPIGGIRFKLRYPAGVGMMFGGMVNRTLDALVEHDPRAFEGWAKGFLNDYMPPMIPTLIRPAAEVALDQSFFTGKSLIPASLEDASGFMQYTAATSETGKAISRALGAPGLDVVDFSPIQFDQMVKGYGGTIGSQLLKALDVPYQAAKKPFELADLPFVSSFVTRNPNLSAEPIQDFYDEMGKLQKDKADFDLAMRRAEGGADMTADLELSAPASQYADAIGPVKEVLQIMSTTIQGINADKTMTDDEKRQATDQLYRDMIGTARQGLEVIDSLSAPVETGGPTTVAAPLGVGQAQAPTEDAPPEPVPGANAGSMPVS